MQQAGPGAARCLGRASRTYCSSEVWEYPRPPSWYEITLPNLPESFFKTNFRVSRATFSYVVSACSRMQREDTNMRPAIPLHKRVAIGMYRWATSSKDKTVGNLFGLEPRFVRFPKVEQLEDHMQRFTASMLPALIASDLFRVGTKQIAGCDVGPIILCDEAFPLDTHLMKPYPYSSAVAAASVILTVLLASPIFTAHDVLTGPAAVHHRFSPSTWQCCGLAPSSSTLADSVKFNWQHLPVSPDEGGVARLQTGCTHRSYLGTAPKLGCVTYTLLLLRCDCTDKLDNAKGDNGGIAEKGQLLSRNAVEVPVDVSASPRQCRGEGERAPVDLDLNVPPVPSHRCNGVELQRSEALL
ncbi:hypothetical protein HPB47_023242 [Ixodes persulcatus]|uniref:Uncharacterized protein n=1 Tax=Ixodes persulcatus TaxID=34615 RepID=A0AC60Q7H5_IXOPE|nr:hypothetical protein HPB47_023242 [Ixodes persulcatus]